MTTHAQYPSPPHTRTRSSSYANRYVPEEYRSISPEETPPTQGYPYAYGKPVQPESAAPLYRRVSQAPALDTQFPADAVRFHLPPPSNYMQAQPDTVARREPYADTMEPMQPLNSPTQSRRSQESRRSGNSHRSKKSQRSHRYSTEEREYERRHRDTDDEDRKPRRDKRKEQSSRRDDFRKPTLGDSLILVWDGVKSALGSKH